MSITTERKQQLIKEYAITENDTGSSAVQCAILTERINNLTGILNLTIKIILQDADY